jgi:glucose/arabinose dehydrogenase
VLKASQLRFQQIDPAGTSVLHEWIKVTDQGRLRTAVQGPDGNLYVATDASPGKILRITPS